MGNSINISTADSIGLGNVDNTADAVKPVSAPQQTSLDLKLNLTGGTLSGDLEFSGAAALEIADSKYAFKSKTDNNIGIFYNATDNSLEFKTTAGAIKSKIFLDTGIMRCGTKRLAADFTKTTDTTIATVTGLQVALLASKNYKFKAMLFIEADATGGSKFRIGDLDTLTATNIIYEVTFLDANTDAYVLAVPGTALDTDYSDASSIAGLVVVEGLIEVNVAGTIGVGFAQSVSNGASSVLRGSTLSIEEVA